ncbi:hypothetical protein SBOR_0247 [Sclerotinia borealis F-4128]|uniref:Uncharacterized protein n=1 Tax=Sclerotinia borealis (strain F-4128) TaxID=1432307 RepID=W9CRG3_SCLBF|nr:hypothetical protein SBOR_0247 [Sclerotinia borealis F-4128]
MYAFHQEQHLFALHMAQEAMLKSAREKSWVMTSNEAGFVKLPNERILYTSPPRTSLQISTTTTPAGAEPYAARSESGVVYISNQRIVYLPSSPTPELQSFSSPILNLQDSFVRAPFFGANYWTALCKPVSGGGIPPDYPSVELKMTFREGGAFDFHSCLEQIKERLYQAYSIAREHGGRGTSGVDLVNIDLEQLPAYEPAREVTDEAHAVAQHSGVASTPTGNTPRPETFSAPAEPPPDYEEAQAQAVSVDLDQRLREQAERQ